MKRKEEIIKAARKYVDGCTLSSPSDVLHFEAGAKWADIHPKNVWHDANEEPKAYNWEILCEDDSEMRWVANHFDAAGNWGYFARGKSLVRWAYIEDLLPKGGEK